MDRKEINQNPNHFIEENNSQNLQTDTINLDDFVIQNQIGVGSFGKVYKLKNKKTGEILAGKISIRALNSSLETIKKDLLREVNIISKLHHPSILKYIGYSHFNFKRKPKPVIITEFAQNGSLRDLIISTFFDDTKKLIILYGIASGMSYLHKNDIIHRDLKPENILIDQFLFPKIADFGLSKINNQNDESILNKSIEACKGTPIYMAPEIWEKYEYSKASDVYAFSIIAYEIMTNNDPFKGLNIFTLPLEVKEGKRPDLNDSIPASYKNLIQQCWSHDPKNRPTFDEILYQLRNNDNFITETVNKKEYLNYIKYINEQNITFDSFKKVNIIAQSNILNISIFENIKIYPLRQFLKLNEECKIFVEEAESDKQKQFQLGQILVEGQGLFYQNAEIGMKYLEKSMNDGLIESAIYLCEMLIKGDIVPRNLVRARKILEKHIKNDEPNYYLLLGKIYKKEKKYREARIRFFQSMKLGNSESMYEFGRIIYKGKCDKPDRKLGITYFLDAIRNDCAQAMFKYGLILKNCEEYQDHLEEAIMLIKIAAIKNHPKAIFEYFSILKAIDDPDFTEETNNYMKKAAYKGIKEAMLYYAEYLVKLKVATGIDNDFLIFLKKASDKGDIQSMYNYGSVLNTSKYKSISNSIDSVKYIRIAANSGFPLAMIKYGELILQSSRDGLSKEDGINYIKKAIDYGSNEAIFSYANLLIKGIYVPLNIEEGIKYLIMGIENGDSKSMHAYANMLMNGIGVPVNKEEAMMYYSLASDEGSIDACVNMAHYLYNGEGIEKDKEEAINIYKTAINNGNVDALFYYAFDIENDIEIIDKSEAIKYYKMAIDKGHVDAMNNLGFMLKNGKGTEMNKELAIKYFKMAIDKGSDDAMVNYSDMLLNGEGVEQDIEESIRLLKIAIDRGNEIAMRNYAVMLLNGKKIEKNLELAIHYLKMAVNKYEKNSLAIYAELLLKGIGIQQNKKEAAKYFKMAADRGVIEAMETYGYMNLYGDGVEQNEEEAMKYFGMQLEAQQKLGIVEFSA